MSPDNDRVLDRDKLLAFIAGWLHDRRGVDPAQVVEAARLGDGLDVDSLELMALVVDLRKATGLDLDTESLFDADTVGDLLSLAEQLTTRRR
ncbi:acyl carrier protein [Nocardia brasiliensis]|uniref:Acyl carrier protein n=1 Tax=Nocardia brasiliensis (strain ATCC 700358 / HUJEG-1) TaxID=1133849 RepID=K0ESK4_NOCB7|nr:acyl carrier protein [Nocardia brasiliensis]AFU00089.1 acyl carrier protein [Nocardia brasiliensis ATCC 700358]OCF86280.1 hypothetical protein AW168_31400 [Nocardia brasiliensis]